VSVSRVPRFGKAAAAQAARAIQDRIGTETPAVGLILGSGLAGLAGRFDRLQQLLRLLHADLAV